MVKHRDAYFLILQMAGNSLVVWLLGLRTFMAHGAAWPKQTNKNKMATEDLFFFFKKMKEGRERCNLGKPPSVS